MRYVMLLLTAVLLLVACGQPGAENPDVPPLITPADNIIPATTATPASSATRLVVMSHDSFNVSEAVIAAFEQAHNVDVELLKAGDTGTALNQLILSKDSPQPLADIFFGVDNTFLSRALDADIFAPYESAALAAIPAELRLDPSNRLLPVDYGYVTINYDKAALEAAGLQPPTSLYELAQPAWKDKLVVQNPATSSPGLAFLLATISHFGESSDYTWKDFWRGLRANGVYVSEGWEDAYYTQFSGSSGAGPYPLVVSYATSPAAEVYFSEGKLSVPPTGNLLLPGASFRQIEFVGILKGSQQRALAEKFIDFMLQPSFQNDIPLQMFVYPASREAQLPELFTQFAEVPTDPASLTPEQIEQNRERWIEEWTQIVLR